VEVIMLRLDVAGDAPVNAVESDPPLGLNEQAVTLNMLKKTPLHEAVRAAFALAKQRIPGAQLQSVQLSKGQDPTRANVYAAFYSPSGTEFYAVRLGPKNALLWEVQRSIPAKDPPFATVAALPDRTQAAMIRALDATFQRFPEAKFNMLSIGVKDGGGLEYNFFQTWDWQHQPTITVDAQTGKRMAQIWDPTTEKQRPLPF
jgi:hypothetical protein